MSFVVFVHVCGSVTSSLLLAIYLYEINFHNLALQVYMVFLYTETGS